MVVSIVQRPKREVYCRMDVDESGYVRVTMERLITAAE